jgi:hypothetical protein
MIADLSDYTETLILKNKGFGTYYGYFQKRVLWTLKRQPDWDGYENRVGYISIPTLAQIAQTTVAELTYSWLFIKVHDPTDTDLIDRMSADLK